MNTKRNSDFEFQWKVDKQIKQLFSNKQKKNRKQYLEKKRREATQRAYIEHKQSQLLLQHQDLSRRAQQPQVILKTWKDRRE